MQLAGKVAAVTGGTAGIGRGIAEAFLAEGASVAINGRSADKGEKTLAALGAGNRAIFLPGDVTKREDVEGFVDATLAQFGRIDILVNNAGGASDLKPVVDLGDEAFDLAMKWNLYSTFWATRRALKPMLAQKSGRIINISSVEGKHGKPVLGPYVAAKHAVNGLTKTVAQEVGAEGVTVNAICPGLVITDIIRETGPATAATMGISLDELIALYTKEAAIKRPNTVEEVAALAVLLASDAGGGITGALLSVDGGTASY